MKMNSKYFKPFPNYEDVFYDDIENHKKYFLPICSVNLKCIDPNRNEWCHFISVKEIYKGCVGEETSKFHTKFTKEDMFGFDIINGKYKFDTTWDYFYFNHKEKKEIDKKTINFFDQNRHNFKSNDNFNKWINSINCDDDLKKELSKLFSWHDNPQREGAYEFALNRIKRKMKLDYLEELEKVYKENTDSLNVAKEYYEKHQNLYPKPLNYVSLDIESMEEKISKEEESYPDFDFKSPEFFGFLDDIKHLSKETSEFMKEYNITLEEMNSFENSNILDTPKDNNGKIFEYIGCLTGFSFQKYGADNLILFQNLELKKAVICLEYT